MKKTIILIASLLFFTVYPSRGQSGLFDFKNQVSVQSGLNFGDNSTGLISLRYIPTLSITGDLKNNNSIDAELSINSYANFYYAGGGLDEYNWKTKPYRLWVRYSSPRFEVRAGLQKISFGSAAILRPMMWFDKIDYRDPLQLTDGVTGLLARYYFKKQVNVWAWALYGNEETKGWEVAPTLKRKAEYGGRLQVPLLKGEVAMSYHHRKADYTSFYTSQPSVDDPYFTVQQIGLDGKWDIGPGIWFEYTLKRNDKENVIFERNEQYLNLGIDYTFGIGNGLNVVGEFFRYEGKEANNFSALAVNYPLSIITRTLAAVYYNWDTGDLFRFLSVQAHFDYWSLNLMAYWNPDDVTIYGRDEARNMMAGTGLLFMAILDF